MLVLAVLAGDGDGDGEGADEAAGERDEHIDGGIVDGIGLLAGPSVCNIGRKTLGRLADLEVSAVRAGAGTTMESLVRLALASAAGFVAVAATSHP